MINKVRWGWLGAYLVSLNISGYLLLASFDFFVLFFGKIIIGITHPNLNLLDAGVADFFSNSGYLFLASVVFSFEEYLFFVLPVSIVACGYILFILIKNKSHNLILCGFLMASVGFIGLSIKFEIFSLFPTGSLEWDMLVIFYFIFGGGSFFCLFFVFCLVMLIGNSFLRNKLLHGTWRRKENIEPRKKKVLID